MKPFPDENLEIQCGEHTCRLAFTRHGDANDPCPLYDLKIFIDGLVMYEVFAEHQVVDEIATDELVMSKTDASNWGAAQLLKLVRGGLNTLDDWCLRHPLVLLASCSASL